MPQKNSREIVKREEITVGYKCNISCRFCFYGCSPADALRSIDDIKKDILLCKSYGIEHIELSGGEPMLHSEIESIVEFCHKQGFKTTCMITNGTMLTDIKKMSCLRDKGLNQFVFSLHGAEAHTHNYLTGADTYRDMLRAIDNAAALKIPFRVNVVVTDKNYRELTKISDLMLRLRPMMINYLIYSPLGFSSNFAKDMAGRYSEMAPEIAKGVDIVKGHMQVRIRYIPFCLIPGYERYICNVHQLHYDPYEWNYALREHLHNGLWYKWIKIFIGLFYIPLGRLLSRNIGSSFSEAIIKTMCLINSCKPWACRRCAYYFVCDGLWKEYASIYGKKELKPVKGRKITDPAFLMAGYN